MGLSRELVTSHEPSTPPRFETLFKLNLNLLCTHVSETGKECAIGLITFS